MSNNLGNNFLAGWKISRNCSVGEDRITARDWTCEPVRCIGLLSFLFNFLRNYMGDYWKENGIEKPLSFVVCAACRFRDVVILGARHWDGRMRHQYELMQIP